MNHTDVERFDEQMPLVVNRSLVGIPLTYVTIQFSKQKVTFNILVTEDYV
jgi:hypothetical protein